MTSWIAWQDGLEMSPDGEVRQIPQKAHWASSVWVTKSGIARRKYYRMQTDTWVWSEKILEYSMDDATGRVGFILDHFITVEQAILLAWKHRAPESATRAVYTRGNVPAHADYLEWREEGSNEEDGEYADETWKRLDWRIGIVHCSRDYYISNKGRLRNPDGQVTRGHFWRDDMYAAVTGAGLVPLTLAAGLRPKAKQIPKHLQFAKDAFLTGKTPEDLSRAAGIKLSTAWNYFGKAGEQFVEPPDVQRLAPNLISRDVWSALHSLQKNADRALGADLKTLYRKVIGSLPETSPYLLLSLDEQMWQLRWGRQTIAATCSSLGVCAPCEDDDD